MRGGRAGDRQLYSEERKKETYNFGIFHIKAEERNFIVITKVYSKSISVFFKIF